MPGYEFQAWFGVFAPARTPRPIVEKISKEIARIVELPDIKKQSGPGRGGKAEHAPTNSRGSSAPRSIRSARSSSRRASASNEQEKALIRAARRNNPRSVCREPTARGLRGVPRRNFPRSRFSSSRRFRPAGLRISWRACSARACAPRSASRSSCRTCRGPARRSASPASCSRPRTATRSSIGNWTSHVGAAAVYPVPWHPVNDLEPISMLTVSTLIIVSRPGLPVKDGKELIAWLKANPNQATMATRGRRQRRARLRHLLRAEDRHARPLRAVQGRRAVHDGPDGQPGRSFLRGGARRCSGTSGRAGSSRSSSCRRRAGGRCPIFRPWRTWAPRTRYIPFWHGLWAPKGTPKNVIARLNDAVVKAFADPVVVKRLTELGQDFPRASR